MDLFLDKENYEKAKAFLPSLASHVEDEDVYRSHLAMTIGPWKVALHGTLPSRDYDVILVFSHIMQSLFRGEIGLWQICDWCRLLWTYRDVSYQKPYPYMRSI